MKKIYKAAVIGAFVLSGISANANTITPVLTGVSAVAGGSQWTYTAQEVNSRIDTGDFFTINDFGTASVVSLPSANWTFSQSGFGPTGDPNSNPPDSAAILNVTFTWNAPAIDVSSGSAVFVLFTTADVNQVLGSWTSQDHLFNNPTSPVQGAHGNLYVPIHPAPDGGTTAALLGFALVGVEGLRRKLMA